MTDTLYMQRCLDLALLGEGQVAPNPMVGAVLVHEGRIIGEGWHERWGQAHAEVNCVRSVLPEDQHLIPYSTLYCSLEPCFHFGKTPPCVELIVEQKIPKVVLANVDPNPKVGGQSVEKMRAAGLDVQVGVGELEGAWLNRVFFHWIRQKRPFVVLKWAQTMDGVMGKKDERLAISGAGVQRLVHRWRRESDAILVGTGTAITDNPRLDARLYAGKNPLRIVFDTKKKIPAEYNILDDSMDTWVFGPARTGNFQRTRFIPSEENVSLPSLLDLLYQNNRATLLVEGGAQILAQFLEMGCWDELRVIRNQRHLAGDVRAPLLPPNAVCRKEFRIEADTISIYSNG